MATRGKKEKEYPPMPANWMYKRGDVYMMDLNPYSGSEQGGIRPAIVVQNDDGNFYSNVLLVVPLTTQIKMRNMPTHFIVISSFEKWYANQVKYHKVNGSPPGEELCKRSYSVPDAAEILKVKPETIYTLIRQGKLKTETTDFCMRIPKEEFERWYRSQSRYRTAADRERDREIEAQTISIPEMAKLLGIPRKNVYGILDCKKYQDCFVIERVADRPRITKKSFKAWLKSQSTYQLQKPKKETHEEPPLKLQCPKNGKYYSFQEIQAFYGISRPTLDSWVLKEGIPTMKLGKVKRIQKDAFDEVLKSKRKVEEDV